MRVGIAGAGLAGLATAAAFRRSGHDVTVYEQADGLRASGLAINLWSNATSLLPALGIPADRIPGAPFSRMLLRASGREAACMALPAGDFRTSMSSPPSCSTPWWPPCRPTPSATASGAPMRARRRWTWTVWQACIAAEVPEIPAGAGAGIIAPGFFSGVWRLPGKRITWLVEQPKRQPGDGGQVLRDLADNEDPVLRTLARATAAEQWIEWRAEDVWPRRTLHRGNVVLVGDAAHAMLPTLGQGACQAIEDAAALVAAVAAEDHLEQALRRYEAARVPRVRRITRPTVAVPG
jgi:2-polyprenyl-6-methoxyphenol hydroxylase-like FAD-dependent oxidoreductase